MECVATCAFGIEAILKREMMALGLTITRSRNGKVYFKATQETMMKANIHLRTAERIFIVIGQQTVLDYDALFDFIKSINLKDYLSKDGKYMIQAKSLKSKVFSPRDIQSISKKALIENLKQAYKQEHFLETNETYRLLVDFLNDDVEVLLDTTGSALHKRGYRLEQGEAPLKETLAAALVLLSFYDKSRSLYDPFCGSGTIAIEAAMIAKNIAPGLNRHFAFEHYTWIDKTTFKKVKREALKAIDQASEATIIARDNDPKILRVAEENAIEAGVDDIIRFELVDFYIQSFDEPYGIIITNPPYGERLETLEDAEALYIEFGKKLKELPTYSVYIISSVSNVEGLLKKKADRTRVLFNGNIKTRYYQYYGPKPT